MTLLGQNQEFKFPSGSPTPTKVEETQIHGSCPTDFPASLAGILIGIRGSEMRLESAHSSHWDETWIRLESHTDVWPCGIAGSSSSDCTTTLDHFWISLHAVCAFDSTCDHFWTSPYTVHAFKVINNVN